MKRSLATMAGDHADTALQALADIAQNGSSEASRVSAAIAILDRAYGKPAQVSEARGEDEPPPLDIHITTREAVGHVRVTQSQ